jgi:AcrR family transcriptional regulator
MPRPSRRDDVLRAAGQRFYRDGITATGVDTVVADAGVAKMTLYGNFGSKDALVVAYLEERDRRFFAEVDAEAARTTDPLDRAMVPVTLYQRYLDEPGFHGCAFVNAAAELAPDHPGREVVAAHKRRMRDTWVALLTELGVADPRTLAFECFLLLEGGFAQAGIGLDDQVMDRTVALIRARLADALDVGTARDPGTGDGTAGTPSR